MPAKVAISGHISSATNCEAPAYTKALISVASSRLKPFCAASAPKAAPNISMPGITGSASRAPSIKPVHDQ